MALLVFFSLKFTKNKSRAIRKFFFFAFLIFCNDLSASISRESK